MSEAHSRRTGIALVIAAAVAWSTAPFFTRLLHFDSWTILFWRGLFGGGLITAFLVTTQGRAGLRDLVETGRSGWLVACLSTLGMVSFIPALQLTSVSNVAIIIATGPFVAAGLAWIWLREAARWTTLIASLVALCGVAIIVGNAAGVSDAGGIGLACLMTLAIAAMTVAIRRYKQISMVAAAALSNFLGSLVSIAFAKDIASVTAADVFVLAMFGFFQVALGLTLFVLGSRQLPSGQASLIATLETPLMPFWVWLAFQELPTPRALVGGALVMGAVLADIIADSRAHGQP
jgi:drug/metabolite transporter (DMT)-like permease